MIERIVDFSVHRRWLVLLATLVACAVGIWSLTKLPIDAVPDVTNVQVQVNAVAPALTPVEYEASGETTPIRNGEPGWQGDGSYLTPEGERLTDDFRRTVYLRTVQDWIVRPQMKTVPGVAGADAIGGFVKQFQVQPDPQKL